MTFILSVFGFLGSLGFYFGVLREVYADPDKVQIELTEVKRENKQLKSQVEVLTDMVKECKESE